MPLRKHAHTGFSPAWARFPLEECQLCVVDFGYPYVVPTLGNVLSLHRRTCRVQKGRRGFAGCAFGKDKNFVSEVAA